MPSQLLQGASSLAQSCAHAPVCCSCTLFASSLYTSLLRTPRVSRGLCRRCPRRASRLLCSTRFLCRCHRCSNCSSRSSALDLPTSIETRRQAEGQGSIRDSLELCAVVCQVSMSRDTHTARAPAVQPWGNAGGRCQGRRGAEQKQQGEHRRFD